MIQTTSLPYWLPLLVLCATVFIELFLDGIAPTAHASTGRTARFIMALVGTAATPSRRCLIRKNPLSMGIT